ncbi:hypothetical protein B0H17DRAFT_1032920 [Mycena rosella]|uniref:Uncharacterized protein n=1 Tax=Mycena rosella TaxID=1033263 RepID=A0AAD7GXJ0_MYCRO|nr:hypothetical protein B0H17DRAFT_1032920 [Mycena rosella]
MHHAILCTTDARPPPRRICHTHAARRRPADGCLTFIPLSLSLSLSSLFLCLYHYLRSTSSFSVSVPCLAFTSYFYFLALLLPFLLARLSYISPCFCLCITPYALRLRLRQY